MLKDTPIMEFDFSEQYFCVLREDLLPFRIRGNISSNENVRDIAKNYIKMQNYFSSRVLGLDRENAKKILNALNLSQAEDAESKMKIALYCNNVSMTDAYWVGDGNQKWDSMDLKKNPLNSIIQQIALNGSSATVRGKIRTPELLNNGVYAKAWVKEEDGIYLYKKSTTNGKESETEVEVSNILDCTNVTHVKYEKGEYEGQFICKCKNMTSNQLGIVSAEEYGSYCVHNDIPFEDEVMRVDADAIYKMNIVDYLISNADRHFGNWGFYMGNISGEIKKCHPLYDHNNAFDKNTMNERDGSFNMIFANYSKKECAEYALKNCDFKITGEITPSMFIDKNHYESFLERASDLGICEVKKSRFPFVKDKILWEIEKDNEVNVDKEMFENMEDMLEQTSKAESAYKEQSLLSKIISNEREKKSQSELKEHSIKNEEIEDDLQL